MELGIPQKRSLDGCLLSSLVVKLLLCREMNRSHFAFTVKFRS